MSYAFQAGREAAHSILTKAAAATRLAGGSADAEKPFADAEAAWNTPAKLENGGLLTADLGRGGRVAQEAGALGKTLSDTAAAQRQMSANESATAKSMEAEIAKSQQQYLQQLLRSQNVQYGSGAAPLGQQLAAPQPPPSAPRAAVNPNQLKTYTGVASGK